MRYGSFDSKSREYRIERVDVPASWTNYLGAERMGSVVAHHGGGYTWVQSPEYMGRDIPHFGRANHPWMTGSAGWACFAATQYMLGIRPDYQVFTIDPCIPSHWNGFAVRRVWRDAVYNIRVENPEHVQKGVRAVYVDNKLVSSVPAMEAGASCEVRVVMG